MYCKNDKKKNCFIHLAIESITSLIQLIFKIHHFSELFNQVNTVTIVFSCMLQCTFNKFITIQYLQSCIGGLLFIYCTVCVPYFHWECCLQKSCNWHFGLCHFACRVYSIRPVLLYTFFFTEKPSSASPREFLFNINSES